MWSAKRVGVLFVSGGVGLTLCDQIHTQLHVLSYDRPALFGQGWWVAPNFGFATILIFAGALPLARAWIARGGRVTDRALAGSGVHFVLAYWATGLFDTEPRALLFGLIVWWALRMLRAEPKRELIVFSLMLGLGGSIYEVMLVSTGVYRYAHPAVLDVPLWLPGIYMNGAPLAVLIAARLIDAPHRVVTA
jgi:hypothetical protein